MRRPKKELKGFAKVGPLAPGESKEAVIQLDKLAFSYYDDAKMAWVAEAGVFEIKAASSAAEREVKSVAVLELKDTYEWNGL